MPSKYLISLLTSSALMFSISPGWGQENTTPKINFSCEDNDGTWITVAKNQEKQAETLFYWKEKAFENLTSLTPKQLCDNTSSKLNSLSASGYDLYLFVLSPWSTPTSLPTICLGRSEAALCRRNPQFLFTLDESMNRPQDVASDVFVQIINLNLAERKIHGFDQRYANGYYIINLFQDE